MPRKRAACRKKRIFTRKGSKSPLQIAMGGLDVARTHVTTKYRLEGGLARRMTVLKCAAETVDWERPGRKTSYAYLVEVILCTGNEDTLGRNICDIRRGLKVKGLEVALLVVFVHAFLLCIRYEHQLTSYSPNTRRARYHVKGRSPRDTGVQESHTRRIMSQLPPGGPFRQHACTYRAGCVDCAMCKVGVGFAEFRRFSEHWRR